MTGPENAISRVQEVVLLPGLMCDARIWRAQCAVLGKRALAINGYGRHDTFADMATLALSQAPPRFALVGHSMGARVALEIMRCAPHRVIKLALLSSGVHMPRPGEAEGRHALLELGRTQGIDALVDAWLPPMVHESRRSDPQLMADLRRMCRSGGVELYAAQMRALLNRPEVASLLPQITCPTLVGVGRQDAWSPLHQLEKIAGDIPGSSLAIFENCGHMAPAEAPDDVNAALLRWLETAPH